MVESKYSGIHIPSGATVYVGDSIANLKNIGVIPIDTATTLDISYDSVSVQGSKKEEVLKYIKNMSAKASTEIYQINMEIINELTGGIMNLSKVSASPVTGYKQQVASFKYNEFIPLDYNNADGSLVSISELKASAKGVLTDANYVQVKDSESRVGIIILDKTGKPLETESLTITYNYTPKASVKVDMGDDVATIKPKIIRFLKMQGGKKFQVTLFSAQMEGGLKFTFSGSDSDKPDSIPISIEGHLDTDREKGKQLLEIIDEIGV